MSRSFALTFDYRCPFARNAHDSVVAGIRAGRPWDVRFAPFSLDQVHVPEGERAVWERPPGERGRGVAALEWGIAVRDRFPERFLDAHLALFAARHDHARRLDDEQVLRDAVASAGVDADAIADEVGSGRPLETLAAEHDEAVSRWAVFGVPTLVENDEAVFLRLMERGRAGDLDRVLELVEWPGLNELKRTRVPR